MTYTEQHQILKLVTKNCYLIFIKKSKKKESDIPIKIPYGLYHNSELGLINRNN